MGNIQTVKKISKEKGISLAFVCRQIGRSHGYLAEIANRDGDEIMDWFTACGASPLAAMQEMLHPELYRKQATDMTDEELDAAIAGFLNNSPRIVKEMILFIVLGKHGSYPPAVIAEICANLHTPLQNKVSVCGQVLDNYNCAVATHTDPVPDEVHPPVELLTTAYKAGKEAARRGETSYTTKRGRQE